MRRLGDVTAHMWQLFIPRSTRSVLSINRAAPIDYGDVAAAEWTIGLLEYVDPIERFNSFSARVCRRQAVQGFATHHPLLSLTPDLSRLRSHVTGNNG